MPNSNNYCSPLLYTFTSILSPSFELRALLSAVKTRNTPLYCGGLSDYERSTILLSPEPASIIRSGVAKRRRSQSRLCTAVEVEACVISLSRVLSCPPQYVQLCVIRMCLRFVCLCLCIIRPNLYGIDVHDYTSISRPAKRQTQKYLPS